MKKIVLLIALLPITAFSGCLDLSGSWVGVCDRDGVENVEHLRIQQNHCDHISFNGLDYKIGMPYEEEGENIYERVISVYNLRWEGNSRLHFDVDRIRWMKHKNQVSTGEGIGIISLNGDKMSYFRSYSSRSREGVYTKAIRKCDFINKVRQ